jgi:hypothetical protein
MYEMGASGDEACGVNVSGHSVQLSSTTLSGVRWRHVLGRYRVKLTANETGNFEIRAELTLPQPACQGAVVLIQIFSAQRTTWSLYRG